MTTSQKVIVTILILILAVILYWFLTSNESIENQPDTSQLPNPAAVHCVEVLGGSYQLLETPAGQVGVCNLPDGRQCEEWELFRTGKCQSPFVSVPEPEEAATSTSAEIAEQAGLDFMLDFIDATQPESDISTRTRLYETLSERAKESVSLETFIPDIARFVGVQDAPDQGVSVEDLQVDSSSQMTLILGLNYSGLGQTLRAVELILEGGVWKVNRVYPLAPVNDKGGQN